MRIVDPLEYLGDVQKRTYESENCKSKHGFPLEIIGATDDCRDESMLASSEVLIKSFEANKDLCVIFYSR